MRLRTLLRVTRSLRRFASTWSRLDLLRDRLAKDSKSAAMSAESLRISPPPPLPPSPPPPLEATAPSASVSAGASALVDRFGRAHTYLRVSLTERCNLRCTYCMPADGVSLSPTRHLLTTAEVLTACSALTRLGVTKIRLTGGEPTLRPDVVHLATAIGALPGLQTLAMTTNGVLLPRLLPGLLDAGVRRLNISMDTLRRDRFERVSRRSAAHWDRAWEGLSLAVAAGPAAVRVKLNCVVMRGVNDDELPDFVRLAERWPLEVRFIELMPFSENGWAEPQFVAWAEQRDLVARAFPGFEPVAAGAGDDPGDTARRWRVPGHAGTVGFVASMSAAFCGSCSRMRLTADGSLRACLHGDGEVDIRAALRRGAGDAELESLVREALRTKHAALGGRGSRFELADAAARAGARGRPMVRIGG